MLQNLLPLGIVAGVFAVFIYFINYNRFMRYKNRIEASWSRIDVALKRRFNLIPALVEIVKQYRRHEADVFETVAKRFNHDAAHRVEDESAISRSLTGLFAVAERYPEIKADKPFIKLQNAVIETEKEIMDARNRYNDNVARYNTLVDAYPSKWIAQWYGFDKYDYFTLELATERDRPKIEL